MPTPPCPLLLIVNNGLELIETDPEKSFTSVKSLNDRGDQPIAFDATGNKWTCDLQMVGAKPSLFAKLFNSPAQVRCLWKPLGPYDLTDLKQQLCICVDMDDDVLTQFVDRTTLKNAILASDGFEALLQTLKSHVFEAE